MSDGAAHRTRPAWKAGPHRAPAGVGARAVLCGWLLAAAAAAPAGAQDAAAAIVRAAVDYWRDVSSYSVADLVIHRPDWERHMRIRVWTQGQKRSLVRVVAPAKDAGNATLLVDNDMWSFTPRINRVIKIPASMMNQSWMGSDFSYNDLAKADDLIEHYTHRLLATERQDGHKVYVIESVPKETAPVVWGREVLRIRDDHLVLEHRFYDQAGVLVKTMTTGEIRTLGGKLIATRQRMQRADRPQEWTEILVREAQFGLAIPDSVFTLANLRHPRE